MSSSVPQLCIGPFSRPGVRRAGEARKQAAPPLPHFLFLSLTSFAHHKSPPNSHCITSFNDSFAAHAGEFLWEGRVPCMPRPSCDHEISWRQRKCQNQRLFPQDGVVDHLEDATRGRLVCSRGASAADLQTTSQLPRRRRSITPGQEAPAPPGSAAGRHCSTPAASEEGLPLRCCASYGRPAAPPSP